MLIIVLGQCLVISNGMGLLLLLNCTHKCEKHKHALARIKAPIQNTTLRYMNDSMSSVLTFFLNKMVDFGRFEKTGLPLILICEGTGRTTNRLES